MGLIKAQPMAAGVPPPNPATSAEIVQPKLNTLEGKAHHLEDENPSSDRGTPLEVFTAGLERVEPNCGHENLLKTISSGKKLCEVHDIPEDDVLAPIVEWRGQARGRAKNETSRPEIHEIWKGAKPIHLGWFVKFARVSGQEKATLLEGNHEEEMFDPLDSISSSDPLCKRLIQELHDIECTVKTLPAKIQSVLEQIEEHSGSNQAEQHPYVRDKGVKPYGAFYYPEITGDELIIPAMNPAYLWGAYAYERIPTKKGGIKKFPAGSKKSGSYAILIPEKVVEDGIVCLTEGWATGCTVADLTNRLTIVVFGCGNFERITLLAASDRILSVECSKILVVPDVGKNSEKHARQACKVASEASNGEISARVCVPRHPNETTPDNFDFNDLWQVDAEAAQDQLLTAVERLQIGDPGDQEDLEPWIQDMNENHAVVRQGGQTLILNLDDDSWSLGNKTDFFDWYTNKKVRIGNSEVNKAKAWFSHKRRREYCGIEFAPGGGREGYFNLWQGFAVEPKEGNCELFRELLFEAICGGNDALYDYFMRWMAHAVQRPEELPGTAPVLRGEQGTGKSTVADSFGGLFGRHYMADSSLDRILGRFNQHLADKVVLHCVESFWGGDKRHAGALKSLVTDPIGTVEAKGKDPIEFRNFKRIILSSNNDWCVGRDRDDRRFLICDVKPKYKRDFKFFTALHESMTKGGREALLYDLQQVDLTGFNVRKLPKEGGGADIKIRSAEPVVRWFYDVLSEGIFGQNRYGSEVPWPEQGQGISKTETRKLFQDWCNNHRCVPCADADFSRALREMILTLREAQPRQGDGTRPRSYIFPPMDACRKYFEEYLDEKGNVNWPDFERDGTIENNQQKAERGTGK